jgi:hypothetical protein
MQNKNKVGRPETGRETFPVRAYKETIVEIRKQAVLINKKREENNNQSKT